MNKKILIGSIIAVAILVGVSLTSVLGYQSVESNFRESPLFNVRSGRAIEKDSNDLSYYYFGKDNKITLPFTEQDSDKTSIQKAVRWINNMSNDEFYRTIILVIDKAIKDNIIESEQIPIVISILFSIKEKPTSYSFFKTPATSCFCSYGGLSCSPFCYKFPILGKLIHLMIIILSFVVFIIQGDK